MKCIIAVFFLSFYWTDAFSQLDTRIDSIFSGYSNSPGGAVGLYSQGKILFAKGYGLANLDYDIPITTETVFDIGSLAKQFTAACILILENEGKLSLDDDIRKFVPELPQYKEGKITIRHLLHHTSGLRDYFTLMYLSGISPDDYFTNEKGLDILTRQEKLNFEPGSKHLYCNSGYLILPIIIQRIANQSLGEFAQNKIFVPLGMKNTFIYEDGKRVVKNRAIGYAELENGYERDHHFDFVAEGDVYTTIKDFFNWNENFKSNKLGIDSFSEKMLTRGILSNGDTINYALGLEHGDYKGLKTISHYGSWGGFRAYYVQFPTHDLSIAIMSNLGSFEPFQKAYQIADILLKDKFPTGSKEEKKEKSLKKSKKFRLDQMIGKYEIVLGSIITFGIENDSLHVLQSWNQEEYNLAWIEGNMFQIPGNTSVQFVFSDLKDNSTQILTGITDGDATIIRRKVEIDVSNMDFNEYTGRFYSRELDIAYLISNEDGILKIKAAKYDLHELQAQNIDAFYSSSLGLLRFKRNNNNVIGFELDAGRATGLTFDKETN